MNTLLVPLPTKVQLEILTLYIGFPSHHDTEMPEHYGRMPPFLPELMDACTGTIHLSFWMLSVALQFCHSHTCRLFLSTLCGPANPDVVFLSMCFAHVLHPSPSLLSAP